MDGTGERTNFEVCVVVSKRRDEERVARKDDCVELLVRELGKIGLVAERVDGVSSEFIKLAAYAEAIGRTATELKFKKLTYAGVNLPFEWEDADAFVRQPDGMLFSWTERYQCFNHLIYGIVNSTDASMRLEFGEREFTWQRNESLLKQMEREGIIGDIFPLHVEPTRKQLLKKWALNLLDFTWQPIDEIYSYFGMKIATYFTFLSMYTRWMFFPASFGLAVQFINLGSWQFLVLPVFTVFLISWAVLFFQFWKRENSSLLASWGINHPLGVFLEHNISERRSSARSQTEMEKKLASDKPMEEKQPFLREEWFGHLIRIRNNAISIIGIICLQLPFELAYAHFFEMTKYDIIRYGLTAIYLLAIQYYTKMGGKLASMLIKFEKNEGMQSSADSMVYKVFGLYFMQSYIGLFYHILLHRNFESLRQILIQRLIVSQVLQHFIENSVPYVMYSYKKFKAAKRKKQEKGGLAKSSRVSSRVEKEYLKPSYSASICAEIEDGTFDDFLELALQFGMVMMFACAFPLAFCFSFLGNITEIRADALKLLVTMRRPVPRAVPTIGAWLNIFQFLIITSICTNCMLLVCLYDQEGKWSLEPGLAAILVMEHVLLLLKFGLSHFVPEEPAWVKAKREQNIGKAQNMCIKQLSRSIHSRQKGEKAH